MNWWGFNRLSFQATGQSQAYIERIKVMDDSPGLCAVDSWGMET